MSAEIQNICGTFISRKIHQPFGRFGSTAAISCGPSSVQHVQGTQNYFLGYRERDWSFFQLVSSLGYGDWGGSFSPWWIFMGGVILHSTRFPTKSWDGRGHRDGIHPILPNAEHEHGHLSLPVLASKLIQAQKTGFCQHAWQAMWYTQLRGKIRELFCSFLAWVYFSAYFHKRIEVNFLRSKAELLEQLQVTH